MDADLDFLPTQTAHLASKDGPTSLPGRVCVQCDSFEHLFSPRPQQPGCLSGRPLPQEGTVGQQPGLLSAEAARAVGELPRAAQGFVQVYPTTPVQPRMVPPAQGSYPSP